ncbi:putative fatty acyl-CoA reductase [Pseudolycoriella hygida]|uniref:Fatty acyl-CoA reductase n=1 Tax=Pseudolycoriella hygida TaxID=35572 RepID=A0A9Q0NFI6_9DIPT|nr:putative fatty acyl-CoA reductase [Pseudolycoriella hygida]
MTSLRLLENTMETSAVSEYYKNKCVFITGGTGYLGMAIVEKLLRSCPDVEKIYLLMRSKRGKSIEQRLEELTKNEVFETLLQNQTREIFKKLVAITGDVSEEHLGISPADRKILIDKVNVVIHSAATLDFNEGLKPTVTTNLLGTRRVMELCNEMKNLTSMVHVSSAFVNAYLLDCEEILYPPPESAEKVIDLATSLTDEALRELQPALLKDHPNTYTFTKHLAEHEVNKYAATFPCGIVRPSMITAAWKEPTPGWTNSKNGPQGFMMGAAKGVVRRLPIGSGLVYDYIPVDIVVNQTLVTGYHIYEKKYPHLKFMSSLFLFKISAIFVHFIPAYILDTLTRIGGGRPILVRLHKNVWNSLILLQKFIFTEWKFHNDNTIKLIDSMTKIDKIAFNIDIRPMDWEEYFVSLTLGVRRYLNKEPHSTLEAARGKDTLLLIWHLLLQALIYGGIWWLTAASLGMSFTKTGMVVPLSYLLFSFL